MVVPIVNTITNEVGTALDVEFLRRKKATKVLSLVPGLEPEAELEMAA